MAFGRLASSFNRSTVTSSDSPARSSPSRLLWLSFSFLTAEQLIKERERKATGTRGQNVSKFHSKSSADRYQGSVNVEIILIMGASGVNAGKWMAIRIEN